MTVGEKIKAIRKAIRMSQLEFSEELKCHQSLVSAYERGEKNPSYKNLLAIDEIAKKYKIKIQLLRT